jgi:hypothetical protein
MMVVRRGGNWWASDEGSAYRNLLRNVTAARGRVAVTAKNKTSKGGAQERDLLVEAASKWHNRFGARWPRPRADIALDVWALTHSNPPQPQNYAKRLLDQLGDDKGEPIIYVDDRQVAMLFVRVDKTTSASIPDTVFFSAQLAASARDSVRYAADRIRSRDSYEEDWQREEDWQSQIDDADRAIETWTAAGSDLAKNHFLPRAIYKSQHLRQQWALAAVDGVAVGIVDGYASLRRDTSSTDRQMVAERLDLLTQLPYAFNPGLLPTKPGESAEFRARVEAAITARMSRYPALFPLLCGVGVTIFYVAGHQGKDLDNALRLLMPPLLKHVHPPSPPNDNPDTLDEKAFPLWDNIRKGKAPPPQAAIAFVEAVVLKDLPHPAGTVIAALSDGRRHQSWWKLSTLDER